MIAANKKGAELVRGLGNFVGTGAVANNIAQVDHCVMLRRRRHARVERLKVGMNIAEDQYAQKPKITRPLDT